MWEIFLDISKQLGKLIISYQNHKEAYGQKLVECQTLQQQPPEIFCKKVFLKISQNYKKAPVSESLKLQTSVLH